MPPAIGPEPVSISTPETGFRPGARVRLCETIDGETQ